MDLGAQSLNSERSRRRASETNGGDTFGRSVEVARVVGSCRAVRILRPSVFQHSKALNFSIS